MLTGARANTPDSLPDLDNTPIEPDDPPVQPSIPPPQGRSKLAAAVPVINPAAVLARISAPISQSTAELISDLRMHYEVPEGVQAAGNESGEFRAGMKRRADGITRSQYEVYSFSTKHNLSEAAVDELLSVLSNVSTSLIQDNTF